MKKMRVVIVLLLALVIGTIFVNNKSEKDYFSDIIEVGNPKRLSSYALVNENDKNVSGTDNVKFDAFFVINGQQRRGNSIVVGENKKLRVILSVEGDAYLSGIKFTFKNTNVNVGFSGTLNGKTINSTNLKDILMVNPIESGRNMDFFLNLSDNLTNDITSFKGTNSIVFEADLTENGQTKRIRKEVFYDVDWYLRNGPTATINDTYTINAKNKDGNLEISYNFGTNVDIDSLLKSVNLDIDLPKLNDLSPISAKIIGTNTTYEADLNNFKLTGKREAVIKDQAIFNSASDYTKNGYSYNSFKVVLEYPTVYEDNISIPPLNVNAWYEVFNNPDDDYQDTVLSNVANKILVRATNITNTEYDVSGGYEYPTYINFVTNTSIGEPLSTGGNYVDKTDALNILDGLDGRETTEYDVTITTTASAVCNGPVEKCAIGKINLNNLSITDNNYDRFNNNASMKNVLKYKTIRFTNTWMLGDSGYIKLINDETGETVHVFTKDDWTNDYTFETDVRKIRIETSAINNVILNVGDSIGALTVYITKEIDNTAIGTNYTRSSFDSFNTINSSTKTTGEKISTDPYNFVDNQGVARYMSYVSSRPTLKLSTGTLKTNENTSIRMTVNTGSTDGLTKGFKDGIFLISLPNPIIGVQVTDITTNNSNVSIVGYEIEEGDSNNIIRVFTSNDIESDFELYVDAILTPNSRSFGANINVELYAINNNIKITSYLSADKYDADKDGNTTEMVGYDYKGMSIVVPTDVITNTTIKTYTNNNQERSVVSPKITDVNPLEDSSNAKVEIMLMNNSTENIRDIIITGKVGFVGNKYQISGVDLGTEYNIPMTSDGITVPASVRDYAKIYYSTEENPSNDLNYPNNNWKTKDEITDFGTVKSYMIILENYSMDKSNLVFTYDVTLPLDKSLINKTSYFTHGVYYNSDTIDGLVYRELGGAKAGIQMAIKYKLDLNVYKKYSSRKIPNAKYVLIDDNNKSRLLVVNSNGYVREEDLYVDRNYQLKQSDVMFPYILDEETKKFKIISDSNDILQLSGSESGIFKSINITNDLLKVDLENEVRYDLLIKNTDMDTLASIPGSSFRITGKGFEEGKEIITNADGELKLHGL
nr:hypothetical protein [Bacilli bacterium]